MNTVPDRPAVPTTSPAVLSAPERVAGTVAPSRFTRLEKEAVHPTTRRLLAAAVVAQPLLIAVNALFHPPVDITGPGLLAGAAAGPTAWFAVHVVAALGALLSGPAAVGLRTLVARPPKRLASTGVALTFVGSAVLSLSFATEASVLRLAATALDQADAAALAEAYTRTPEFFAIPVGVLAGVLGAVLIGAALLAGRSVPRWQPVVYLLGTLASLTAAPGSPVGPMAFAAVAVASAAMAARIVRVPELTPTRPPVPAAL